MPTKKKKVYRRKKSTNSSSKHHKLLISKYKDVSDTLQVNSTAGRVIEQPSTKSNYEDVNGVKRIFSPFNRFAKSSTRPPKPLSAMPQKNVATGPGLSPKERSYVLSSFEARTTRYTYLKQHAAAAIRENKIFTIFGICTQLRKALLERGWVEKLPANRMNLSKLKNGTYSNKTQIHNELERLLLSNMVEKKHPNFIWCSRDEFRDTAIDMMSKDCPTIVNKLKLDAIWTSKQGLCSSMKRNYWFYIEDVSEVNCPRTYNTYEFGETEGFVKDYEITACTSLLKWILSMVANDRPIFAESGKISMNTIVFALNRCKEYLIKKQNKDIDRTVNAVSQGQWNSFLKKYYRIISRDDVFTIDLENKLPLYMGYAKFLLNEMHRFRPQLSCEGCHNIWIIKPAHCSRGRGIRMASKLGVITSLLTKTNAKYVIQKYIEEPLLIHDTKFDIRQYYLVTSTYPLVIWMYKDCYLKFSSQKYNLKNYHESIHLTNNAVQRKYKNCVGRHSELPQQNMWELDRFKEYLNKIGKTKVWDKIIYPGMRKSIIGIMLSCQDSLPISKNRFELYGCDFILDKEYKPWLIEINACPDLNYTTQVTAKLCPIVIEDIIKVIIDRGANPRANTGKFECIYRQPMTIPRYGQAAELFVRGFGLPIDYFYRGNIELKQSFDYPFNETDIVSALEKLKRRSYTDIMIEPDDTGELSPSREERGLYNSVSHNTISDNEISVAATLITDQLDELLDRITSDNTLSSKTLSRTNVNVPTGKPSLINAIQNAHSVMDLSALLKKSLRNLALSNISVKNDDENFSYFTKLGDNRDSEADIQSLKLMFDDLPLNREEQVMLRASQKISSDV